MEENWIYGDDVRYAYATGRVRAMETRLLGRGKIESMAEAKDVGDVLRILGDTEYFGYLSALEDPRRFEDMLLEENRRILDLFRELSLDEEITDYFLSRYDFHNLKSALKERHYGEENPGAYTSLGTLETSLLRTALNEEYHLLPSPLEDAARNADVFFAERQNPAAIDNAVEQVRYRYYYDLVTQKRYFFMYELARKEMDLHNIRTFFRVRKKEGAKKILQKVLLEEGEVSHDFFLRIVDESDDSLITQFENTPYRSYVTAAGSHLHNTGSYTLFEKLYWEELLNYLKKSHLISFGIEPLVAYLYAKENEVRLIRIIMVGKLNDLSSDVIRENLPNVYF